MYSNFFEYSPFAVKIEELGFSTDIIVLIICSLGNIHYKFVSGLMICALPRHDAIFEAKYLSIIGSFKIWKKDVH